MFCGIYASTFTRSAHPSSIGAACAPIISNAYRRRASPKFLKKAQFRIFCSSWEYSKQHVRSHARMSNGTHCAITILWWHTVALIQINNRQNLTARATRLASHLNCFNRLMNRISFAVLEKLKAVIKMAKMIIKSFYNYVKLIFTYLLLNQVGIEHLHVWHLFNIGLYWLNLFWV